MVDNRGMYGFRPHRPVTLLDARTYKVADTYQASLAGNVDLGVGDVVILTSAGTVALCPGTESTEGAPFGVIVAVNHYFDGQVLSGGDVVPGGSTGGGVHERQASVEVIEAGKILWEVAVDDAVLTTRAAYETLVNNNIQLVNADDVTGRASPKLDRSTAATTETHGWRIVGVSPAVENRDFTGANVKLLVQGNAVTGAGAAATRVAGI
jgi:hypothetical protein